MRFVISFKLQSYSFSAQSTRILLAHNTEEPNAVNAVCKCDTII